MAGLIADFVSAWNKT